MDDADDDEGGSEGDELAQPSFNDRLNIIDFPVVGGGGGDVATSVAGASPAATSLHTPTPPNVGDNDETQFSFEMVTSSSARYQPSCSPTIITLSQYMIYLLTYLLTYVSFIAGTTVLSTSTCLSVHTPTL